MARAITPQRAMMLRISGNFFIVIVVVFFFLSLPAMLAKAFKFAKLGFFSESPIKTRALSKNPRQNSSLRTRIFRAVGDIIRIK